MVERILRGTAGFFILISLLLAHYVNPKWVIFTAIIGLNLFQSAFTNWYPMSGCLRKWDTAKCNRC